jgi:hypothetical protein
MDKVQTISVLGEKENELLRMRLRLLSTDRLGIDCFLSFKEGTRLYGIRHFERHSQFSSVEESVRTVLISMVYR